MRFETGLKHPHPNACVEMQNKRLSEQVAGSTHPNSELNVMWSTTSSKDVRFRQAPLCLRCSATPWASYKLQSAGLTEAGMKQVPWPAVSNPVSNTVSNENVLSKVCEGCPVSNLPERFTPVSNTVSNPVSHPLNRHKQTKKIASHPGLGRTWFET